MLHIKKLLFLIFTIVVNLQAKSGVFILAGAHGEKDSNPQKEFLRLTSIGYTVDYSKNIGMGLEGGYSFYSNEIHDVDKNHFDVKTWSLDLFWLPMIVNIGKYRLITKFGKVRYHKLFFQNSEFVDRFYKFINVVGLGSEIFIGKDVSIGAYSLIETKNNRFSYQINEKLIEVGRFIRFELALRYTFPTS